jgi:hypothetical protein
VKLVEICCSQVIDIEPVAEPLLKAIEFSGSLRL